MKEVEYIIALILIATAFICIIIFTSLGVDICPTCLGYKYKPEKQDERS